MAKKKFLVSLDEESVHILKTEGGVSNLSGWINTKVLDAANECLPFFFVCQAQDKNFFKCNAAMTLPEWSSCDFVCPKCKQKREVKDMLRIKKTATGQTKVI